METASTAEGVGVRGRRGEAPIPDGVDEPVFTEPDSEHHSYKQFVTKHSKFVVDAISREWRSSQECRRAPAHSADGEDTRTRNREISHLGELANFSVVWAAVACGTTQTPFGDDSNEKHGAGKPTKGM